MGSQDTGSCPNAGDGPPLLVSAQGLRRAQSLLTENRLGAPLQGCTLQTFAISNLPLNKHDTALFEL